MITPAQGKAQSAAYRVTFEGKWTTAATPDGVPGGAHFTPLIGAVRNDQVTFWREGGTASAGIESMAEVGGTNALKTDITAAGSNAGAVIERIGNIGATATVTADFTVTSTHPLVTLLSMITPSPDWFVGVSGLSLRNAADDGWQPSLTADLFPYDAGTEEGTEFSLNNIATSPKGTITSIKGTGKFSNEPIASLTFTLQAAAPEITSAMTFTVDEGTTAVEALTAEDQDSTAADLEWSKADGADADHFTLSAAGELAFAAAMDYENPDDADGDRTYEITVQVSDGDNTDTADIRVTLQNVVELLTELEGPSSTDYAENGAVRVAAYIVSSPEDNGDVARSLSGADSGGFSIDGGALRFFSLPDFETPSDMGTDNMYSVTVSASDGSANVTKDVTVTVTDRDEAGALLPLSSTVPRPGTPLTATVTDADGVTGTTRWTSGSVLPAGPVDEAQTVVRGPYLQRGTSSSVIIKWRTDEATDSVVHYGLAPDSLTLSASDSDSTTEHAVQLTGLSADAKVFYSVGTSSVTLAGGDRDHFVVTAPVPGTAKPTRVWVIGDSGTADNNARAVRDAFLDFTGSRDPDLWIMLGGNAYNEGNDVEYQAAVFDTYPQVLRKIVLWPTLGNHDGRTADSTTESGPYYDIFPFLATAKPAESPPGRKPITPLTTGICILFAWIPTKPTARRTGR